MSKKKDSVAEIIEVVLKSLEQSGVTLVNVDFNSDPPQYFVQLDKGRLIRSEEETLQSTYGILWVLTYGKLDKSNKNNKIDLKYEVVGEISNANN